jgi:hypothetical protein
MSMESQIADRLNVIRGIKIVWCWIVGHDHQTAGDYSMCWRCGQIKRSANAGAHTRSEAE